MKHLFLIVPMLLLFLVNSCNGVTATIPSEMGTAVAQTQTALVWTAVPTATYNPNIPTMISWLNNDLATVSPLGRTLDAEYHVINVSFPNVQNDSIFQVDVGCICMNNSKCCIPERTFVVVVEAMKRYPGAFWAQVPGGINEIMVVCSDHQTKTQIGAVTASWQDVQGYLQGYVSRYQLEVRTTRT